MVARLLRNPVAQFLAAGLLALVAVVIATGQLSQRAAAEEAVADSRATTELLARSVAEPAIPRGLVDGRAGAIDRFDRAVLDRLMVDDVQRIKIWAADGTIVYSDKTQLIGRRYDLGADEQEVLANGDSDAEVSDLSRPENRFEAGSGGLLEVYTRVTSPEGEPLLFEVYYSASDIAERQERVFDAFRPITLGGLVLLVALATPMIWALTRRLRRASEDRERLSRAAVEASDAERRRIARDLHDGVVQDLAGTAFAVSAAAQNATDPVAGRQLADMGSALRKSLRALRSLLVEIYPPDLHTSGLRAAIQDLVAPAAAVDVVTTVEVADVSASEDSVALVWRTAQEAVRNALRHAAATELSVTVEQLDGRIVLEVADNGVGFDSGQTATGERFGLRGLRDLIREAGGTLTVDSTPGSGTKVRLEVAA